MDGICHPQGALLFGDSVERGIVPHVYHGYIPFLRNLQQQIDHLSVSIAVVSGIGIEDNRTMPGILHILDDEFYGPRHCPGVKGPCFGNPAQRFPLRRIVGGQLADDQIEAQAGVKALQACDIGVRVI